MKIKLFLGFFLLATFCHSQSLAFQKVIVATNKLEITQNLSEAENLWSQFEKQNKTSKAEKRYIQINILYYKFLKSNKKDIHSLKKGLAILDNIRDKKAFEATLFIKTNRCYFEYLSQNTTWKNALKQALYGYKIKEFLITDKNIQAQYLYALGTIYRECKNPYEAIAFYTKSLNLNKSIKGENNTEIAHYYNDLGDAFIENYNPTKADECYKKAISILEKISTNKPQEIDELLTAYRNMISNLLEYGAKEEALKVNNKSNTLFYSNRNQLKKHSQQLYFHTKQVQVDANVTYYSATGNFEIATQYCDSLKQETPINSNNTEAIAFSVMRYFDVLDFVYEFEDYEQTVKRAHELEPIINKYNFVVPKLLVNAKLGTSYEKLKKYNKALHHIKIAEQIIDKEHFNSSKYSIQIIKAIILSRMNKNQTAISISKNALEQLVYETTKNKITIDNIKFENVADLADAYFVNIFEKVADLYLIEYKTSKHKKDIEIAENLYQIAGKLFQEYYLKGEFNDYLSYYQNEIVQGLLECSILKEATFEEKVKNINLIERNASQHLLKEFDKKIKRRNSANTVYLNQINTLKTELEFYKKQKTTLKKDANFNTNKIKSLQKEINELSAKISLTEKNYKAFNSSTFNVSEVISMLKEDEQLLKYYVCNNDVYLIAFAKNSIDIKKIGDKKTVEIQIKKQINETNSIEANFKNSNSTLYSLLIPISLKNKLIVIPDNFLNYLPFETLYNPKNKKRLVENHYISYNYSLPIWLLHQKSKSKSSNINLAAFSPFYPKTAANTKRSDFKELKFARVESEHIVSLFDGTLFSNEKATKANFLKVKEDFNIFHLSMHSQLFEDDFNKSCLLFSNEDRLFFSDLYGMNIPAAMVVLSACDTGNGTLKKGEGIMSLSRALTYAGVKSAVVSLWQVPDKETSEIMVSFYENLKKGQAKDEALANAKTTFIKNNPMKNHPYYWAGFIVNGDISPIVTEKNWMLYFAIILGILVLLVLFRKKLFQFR